MLKAGVWAATAKATDAGEMHKQKKGKCLILTFELKKWATNFDLVTLLIIKSVIIFVLVWPFKRILLKVL